jgi:hypothetical protein|nr:MAG TPA: hypothetical protein [Bacteriophage sp.]
MAVAPLATGAADTITPFTEIVGIIVEETVPGVPIAETSIIYVPLLVTTSELPETIILLALEVATMLPGCKTPPNAAQVWVTLFFI